MRHELHKTVLCARIVAILLLEHGRKIRNPYQTSLPTRQETETRKIVG